MDASCCRKPITDRLQELVARPEPMAQLERTIVVDRHHDGAELPLITTRSLDLFRQPGAERSRREQTGNGVEPQPAVTLGLELSYALPQRAHARYGRG